MKEVAITAVTKEQSFKCPVFMINYRITHVLLSSMRTHTQSHSREFLFRTGAHECVTDNIVLISSKFRFLKFGTGGTSRISTELRLPNQKYDLFPRVYLHPAFGGDSGTTERL